MDDRALHIAFEATRFMEECLTPEITGEHEIYFDPAVDEGGEPFVSVSISGRDGVGKLTGLFGKFITVMENNISTDVPVFIREYKSTQDLN